MYSNFIGGQWVASSRAQPNINPSDLNDVIGEYALADAAQAVDAIGVASRAAELWAHSTPQERADVLDRIGTEVIARRNELGDLLAREEGKTTPEAIGEVLRAGNIFKFFAGEALRSRGESGPSVRPNVHVDISREPLGVVSIITPWNFPIAIPSWKIAPALAFGNAVVFKPADAVPGSAWSLADIISRSGLPAGTFNLVMGRGSEIGPVLVDDSRVTGVTFTGFSDVGRSIARSCAARLAKCQLEMGGSNPLVVLDDADLSLAVEIAIHGAYFSTGQRCTASSRLIVTDPIHDAFVAALTTRIQSLVVDDARKPGTQIGPVVSEVQLAQDLEYVSISKGEGARLLIGGERLQRATPGYYMAPALFVDATNEMRSSRDEVFGPVANVIRVRDYDEALAVANETPMGLVAGIATRSLKYATHFRRHAQAGMVMVNLPTAGVDFHVPFGGRKGSSYGPREQGEYAVEFYTTVKTAYTFAG